MLGLAITMTIGDRWARMKQCAEEILARGSLSTKTALRFPSVAADGPDVIGVTSSANSHGGIGGFLFFQVLTRQENSFVEFVGETAVAATDLHGDYDKFADDSEFGREGCVDTGVAEGEADGAVGADNFKEYGKEGEVWVAALDAATFGDGDDEKAQEYVPQIEG